MYSKLSSIVLVACMLSALAHAENPIVPDVGLNDPHVHIFNDKAYVWLSAGDLIVEVRHLPASQGDRDAVNRVQSIEEIAQLELLAAQFHLPGIVG